MKPTKTLFVTTALILGTMGVQAADFVQNGNYLTVQLKQHQNYGPSQIRLQVVGDHIIRVQATAEQSFRSKQSLIIVPQNSKAPHGYWLHNGRNEAPKPSSAKAHSDDSPHRKACTRSCTYQVHSCSKP